VLILDEPANGLDPVGIAWLRGFLRELAGQGKTILVSSHQLAEMQSTVDDVIIINKGELMVQGSLKEVIGAGTLEEAFLKLAVGGDK
jgi:ABC-2 type transport system ATP-binding protein